MTRNGFRSLALLLLAGLLGGGWLVSYGIAHRVAPELVEEEECASWLARPREGTLRLRGCTLDLTRATVVESAPSGGPTLALVEVVREGDGPRLFAESDDPDVLARAARLDRDVDDAQRARTVERFRDALRLQGDVEGRIWSSPSIDVIDAFGERFRRDQDYVAHHSEDGAAGTLALGITLVLLTGPLLLVLVLAQRRWQRRAEALRAARDGLTRPRTF